MLSDGSSAPLFTQEEVIELCEAVVAGLSLDERAGLHTIGGARHVVTTSFGLRVAVVGMSVGSERYFHIIHMQGQFELATFFVVAQLLGHLLGVPVSAEARLSPIRGMVRVTCAPVEERALRERLQELRAPSELRRRVEAQWTLH